MRVLPLLMDTPSWAGAWNQIPADTSLYADYVAHVVARYGPGGDFWKAHPELPADAAPTHFELWNEPYLQNFSAGGADPAKYARTVSAAVTAGRAANPNAKFLLEADLTSTNDFQTYREWIDAMYAAVPNLGSYFDAVAIHPYGDRGPDYYTPSGNVRWQVRRLEQIKAKFAAHGDGDKHLWITELGWTTCTGLSDCVTEAEQAQFYTRMAEMVRTQYAGTIDALIFYGWRTLGSGDPADKEQNYAIMRKDGSKKPAWDALRRITGAA
jgi:hypothetical protein